MSLARLFAALAIVAGIALIQVLCDSGSASATSCEVAAVHMSSADSARDVFVMPAADVDSGPDAPAVICACLVLIAAVFLLAGPRRPDPLFVRLVRAVAVAVGDVCRQVLRIEQLCVSRT